MVKLHNLTVLTRFVLAVPLSVGITPVAAQTCVDTLYDTAPNSRYEDNQDGTVTDIRTGLMWKQCHEGTTTDGTSGCNGTASTFTWQQGLQRPDIVNGEMDGEHLGYSDWRLPNIKEAVSLRRSTCIDPSINISFFPVAMNNITSTTKRYNSGDWYTFFSENLGLVYGAAKSTAQNIRLVREAKQELFYLAYDPSVFNATINRINERGLNERIIVDDKPIELYGPVAASDDGKKIVYNKTVEAFVDERLEDVQELFISDADGKNELNLSVGSDGSEFYNPIFSPDGTKVAFIKRDPDYYVDIFIVGTDGGDLVEVTAAYVDADDIELDIGWLSWSSDGTAVFFGHEYDDILYKIGITGTDQPSVVSPTEILSPWSLAFSPDRNYFAWSTPRGLESLPDNLPRDELSVMDLSTGDVKMIYQSPDKYTLETISWSPDNDVLAIFDTPKTLKFVPIDGVTPVTVSWDLNSELDAQLIGSEWSPDKKKIVVYTFGTTQGRNLKLVDIASGNTINLTPTDAVQPYYPKWKP
jgi:Tol biopolymer transport system component